MNEYLLQSGVSNLLVSLALAALAWAAHASGKRPMLAHLLWLLVLIKLVTPPLFQLAVIPVPSAEIAAAGDTLALDGFGAVMPEGAPLSPLAGQEPAAAAWLESLSGVLLWLWALGSLVVFAVSLTRILRFHRWLLRAARPAPPEIQDLAAELADRLGLRSAPTVLLCSAQLSPLVWWLGGKVRVLIPSALAEGADAAQLRWILAHELGHLRRRDHLVRWLEWIACVAFWWNPVMWWARRNLRINEEICCDALVLAALRPKPRAYADALMRVVEFLAAPAIRPPAMASAITSGGILEKRFKMIVSDNGTSKTPRWQSVGALMFALCVTPLGVAYAQDYEAVERRLGEGVAHGELTLEQASAMMEALHDSARKPEAERALGLELLGGLRHRQALEEWVKAAELGVRLDESAMKQLEEFRRAQETFRMHERKLMEEGAWRERQLRAEAMQAEALKRLLQRRLMSEEVRARIETLRAERAPSAESGEGTDRAESDRRRVLEKALEELNQHSRAPDAVSTEGDFRARNRWFGVEDQEKNRDIDTRARLNFTFNTVDMDQAGRLKRYAEVAGQIGLAISAGQLAPEEGKRRLDELRNQLWPSKVKNEF